MSWMPRGESGGSESGGSEAVGTEVVVRVGLESGRGELTVEYLRGGETR